MLDLLVKLDLLIMYTAVIFSSIAIRRLDKKIYRFTYMIVNYAFLVGGTEGLSSTIDKQRDVIKVSMDSSKI